MRQLGVGAHPTHEPDLPPRSWSYCAPFGEASTGLPTNSPKLSPQLTSSTSWPPVGLTAHAAWRAMLDSYDSTRVSRPPEGTLKLRVTLRARRFAPTHAVPNSRLARGRARRPAVHGEGRKAACPARPPPAPSQRGRPGRAADRRPLGRERADDCSEHAAGVRLAAAQARRGSDCQERARLPAA